MRLPRTVLIPLLLVAGLVLSGILVLQHHGEAPGLVSAANQLCGEEIGSGTGCEAVAAGPYSGFLGLSIAAFGVLFYLSLALLLGLAYLAGGEVRSAGAAISLLAVGAALVIDVVLLGVQVFVIGRYCNLCLTTYLVNAGLLVLLLPARRSLGTLWQTLRRREGRLVLAGWVLASVALALAVGASDLVFSFRAEKRQASLLGTLPAAAPAPPVAAPPPPVAAPPPMAPAPVVDPHATQAGPPGTTAVTAPPATQAAAPPTSAELEKARAEARRLQTILDNPRLLQQYLDDKAWKEYEDAPVQKIDLTGLTPKGPAGAPIHVVEFSDFLCPFCRSIAGAFRSFIPQSRGLVDIYFKNYPLEKDCNDKLLSTLHPGACQMALGSICALQQGPDAFWSYHDKAFTKPLQRPKMEDVVGLAAEAGLDFARLEQCMKSGAAREQLASQIEEAHRLGVNATPTLFINGKKLPRVNDFVQAVNAEATRLGRQPLVEPAGE
jgi:protein-disulfide isomerase/uncharacterized membrane protein